MTHRHRTSDLRPARQPAHSVDADKNRELAASKFSVTPDAVTDTRLDEIEAEQVRAALLPFHNPQLREILLRPEHQVIDKFTRDQLLTSSFDPEAKHRSETLVTSFRRRNVSGKALAAGENNKDEIEERLAIVEYTSG